MEEAVGLNGTDCLVLVVSGLTGILMGIVDIIAGTVGRMAVRVVVIVVGAVGVRIALSGILSTITDCSIPD